MLESVASFRFYEELNDFLPPEHQKATIEYRFRDNPGIKDPIEALGIPHSEVELIVVNGNSVGFDYRLQHNDRVSVYPVFESFDVTPLIRLRDKPLRNPAFIVDVNLGKLARWLRMLGFDTLWRNDYDDAQIVSQATENGRIILTRDRRLLYHKRITHGYWVRAVKPALQINEVLARLNLERLVRPFHRCIACNGLIHPVAKDDIDHLLEPLTRKYYEEFYQCGACGKVYWKGSHYEHMLHKIARLNPGPN